MGQHYPSIIKDSTTMLNSRCVQCALVCIYLLMCLDKTDYVLVGEITIYNNNNNNNIIVALV